MKSRNEDTVLAILVLVAALVGLVLAFILRPISKATISSADSLILMPLVFVLVVLVVYLLIEVAKLKKLLPPEEEVLDEPTRNPDPEEDDEIIERQTEPGRRIPDRDFDPHSENDEPRQRRTTQRNRSWRQ